MFTGLLGALFAIGIICIIAWAIMQILGSLRIGIPSVVTIIIWAVVGVVCLVLLANGMGIAIPGM